jgi:hypothetical protein
MRPAGLAQNDLWFPPVQLPAGSGQVRRPVRLPVLTMVTGYSRWLSVTLMPSRRSEDLFASVVAAYRGPGAVPRWLVWNGEGAIGRWRAGKPGLTAGWQTFCGTLAAGVIVCMPAGPEAKGLTGRAHDYLERSFLSGRVFAGPADFNAELTAWLGMVNARPRAPRPWRRLANCMIALAPLGRGTGREVEPQVFDVVAAEPGDEADGGPQSRRPRVPVDRAADLREA